MQDPIQTYHWGTAYDPMEMKGHPLDWANQPLVYKHIEGLPSVVLPNGKPSVEADYSGRIVPRADCLSIPAFSLEVMSRILFSGYGITARRSHAGGVYEYRSVPSAGALYPCELYAACREVDGLMNGLYHYEISSGRLVLLRRGDHTLPPGTSEAFASACPMVTFYITAILYRSIWKYRERSYRYHLLDSGHLVESLAMAVHASGFRAEVTYDFDDQQTNVLLGGDPGKEMCLAIVAVKGKSVQQTVNQQNGLGPIPETAGASWVSSREDVPEAVRAIQTLSCNRYRSEREGSLQPIWDVLDSADAKIPIPDIRPSERMSWDQAALSRRSSRNFVSRSISKDAFAYLLRSLVQFPEDACNPNRFVFCGLLSAACEGFEIGQYWIDTDTMMLLPVQEGKMTGQMANIALQQRWLSLAGMHVIFVSSLQELHTVWGPRGYRYTMLSAGRLAHRIYIAATAIGCGCCGIGAFFDRHAAAFLRLPPQCALLYFVGAGPIQGSEK